MPSRRLDIEAFARARATRVLTDSVRDYAIFLLDPTGRVVSWSAGAKALKGYDEDEIVGRSFSVFHTPEGLAAGKPQSLLRVAAAEGMVEDEGWRLRKDGSRYWADVVISAVRHGDQLDGFIKVVRDLTARRSAEEALRRSEERLRLLVEAVNDYAIFMLDPEGCVASWNPGAERIKGYRANEILGRHLSVFYPEEDVRAGVPQRSLEVAARQGSLAEEGWRLRRDGSRFWASVVISPVRNASGMLIGFTKVTRDDTDRKRAADELAARAQRQAEVAEFGVYALQTRELEGVLDRAIELVSSTLRADLALLFEHRPAPGDLVLRACRGCSGDLVGRVTLPAGTESQLGQALGTAEPVVVEDYYGSGARFSPPPLPGGEGLASGVAVVIHAHSDYGAPFGVLGAYTRARRTFSVDEVSHLQAVANVVAAAVDRQWVERELRAAEAQAELERDRVSEAREDLRRRDEFISVAAHELRTPLAALQLNLHTLERALQGIAPQAGDRIPERARNRAGDALRLTKRLSQLLGRLLDVSRIGEDRFELHVEQFDLVSLVQEVIDDFHDAAAKAGCRVTFGGPATATGWWDRVALQEVVANLLSNAIKYGRGSPVDVHLEVEEAGSTVLLEVRDHGIGISPEDADRIFRRFERAAPARQYAGLGLGLYITRHIVEAHGGSIRVQSSPGQGAAFRVELPTRRNAQPRASTAGAAR
jgi:PAS domain S-box-containing protein